MGYPKRKTVSYDRTMDLTYFLDHNNKKLERNNQERRKSMKRIKKTLKGKGKIVAALAVVISFASVIAWYTSMNAHAFGTYDAGGNKHFEEGHLTINMNGPDGKVTV